MLNAFRSSGRGKGTSVIVWGLLGLLIVGLTGLGLGGAVASLSSQSVARVGDQSVERDHFVRTLQRQIASFSQQVGQPLSMEQARLFGLDRQVLSQLAIQAALNGKAEELGLSVGDRIVAQQLREASVFAGLSGDFDPEAYAFFLERNGLTATQYENQLRRDLTRTILEVGVAAGTEMPPVMAELILAHNGEQRGFTVAALTPETVTLPEPAPEESVLRSFYEENPGNYTIPETRIVTYVRLSGEDLRDTIEVTEDQLRGLYESRAAEFNTPERRVVDLIAFATMQDAEAAKARIDAGEETFADIAEARGLSANDLSIGTVSAEDLSGAARDAVFAAEGPGVVGPVQTDLGPGLYRINAVIAARETSFEQAKEQLRDEFAQAEADSLVLDWYDPVQDLIASGATLEEIADETPMVLGEIGLTNAPGAGLAGDMAFRQDAFESEVGEERDAIELSSGGIAALRVERIDPPVVQPYEDVADAVLADWRAAETQRLLVARAEEMQAALNEGQTMAAVAGDAGLNWITQPPVTREGRANPNLPGDILQIVFDLEDGGSTVVSDFGRVYLVQLTQVIPVDTASDAYAAQMEQLSAALNGSLANAMFDSYAQRVTDEAGVTVNQQLIEDTLALYP
ncbi:SurA N-terminal domain-containing protein [Oceanibium sediminis]|uniref:SurA N-terminal domain-containing protein n=1 Tax=Oceanibium sediminis TaxID=2026339 RepID=UPI000DD4E329|nr:SurA N-terminal domain-containing protein [Oceanibium sediminis]